MFGLISRTPLFIGLRPTRLPADLVTGGGARKVTHPIMTHTHMEQSAETPQTNRAEQPARFKSVHDCEACVDAARL